MYTAKVARKTSEMAEDAQNEAKGRVRPVLIPPAQATAAISRINSDLEPLTLRFQVMNAGTGPALNAYAYALIATSAGSTQTEIAVVGSVAPQSGADVAIPDVPDRDTNDDRAAAYLACYVTLVYDDVSGRTYHSLIGLSDPANGGPQPARPGFINGPRSLHVLATDVGDGAAPQPQWRVTFSGPEIANDQRRRLTSANVVLFGRHASGTGPVISPATWRWSAYAQGPHEDGAIARVRGALADDRFVSWAASLWTHGRMNA